jgi:hypothetical protein
MKEALARSGRASEAATARGGTVGRDSESSRSHVSSAPSLRPTKKMGARLGDQAAHV